MRKFGALLFLLVGMVGKRPPAARTEQTPATPSSSREKKSKKTAPNTEKVAVPDDAPLMDAFKDSETNAGISAKAIQSVHDWLGEAMEPQAWAWLSANLSFVMSALKSNVRGDVEKRANFEKIQSDLIKHGWKSQTTGCFSEWSFFQDGITTSVTKVNKAVKAASTAANAFLEAAKDDEREGLGGGDGLGGRDDGGGGSDSEQEEFVRRDGKAPAHPQRGTREEDELPFIPPDFLAAELASPPPFVRQVTNHTLRADRALDQRASAFGLGSHRPANHLQASGDNGFNMTFGCATTDYGEARVLQENPRTGNITSVAVGAPKTYAGLLSLYEKETNRLESVDVNGAPHPDLSLLRKYIFWFTIEGVKHTQAGGNPKIVSKFLEHDQQFREKCNLAGKLSVDISALNASWALALSELALNPAHTTPARTYHGSFGQGGSNRGGGASGWGAPRTRDNFHGDRGSFQGNRGTPHGGRGSFQGGRGGRGGRGNSTPVCHDFAVGSCNRNNCKYKHVPN
jgi:hypothetical protein